MSRQRTSLLITAVLSWVIAANLSSCQAPTPEEPAAPVSEVNVRELDAAFTQLDIAIRENVEQDQVRLIAGLAKVWEETDKLQKKRFRGQLDQGIKHENVKIRMAVFQALSSLRGGAKNREAKISTKSLVRALSLIQLEEYNDLVIQGLQSLGQLRHVSGLTVLFDHLTHKDTAVAATAITALGNYDEGKLDHRKLIFGKVITAIPDEQADGRKLKLEAAADKALASITKHSFKGKAAWKRWWSSEGQKLAKW